MEEGRDGTDALEGLPAACASWRASTLGQITDRLELDLMLEMIGPASGPRVLDVSWRRTSSRRSMGASAG